MNGPPSWALDSLALFMVLAAHYELSDIPPQSSPCNAHQLMNMSENVHLHQKTPPVSSVESRCPDEHLCLH